MYGLNRVDQCFVIKALTFFSFAIIEIFNNDFFKVVELSVGNKDGSKTVLPLFFVIEKLNTGGLVSQAFKSKLGIIKAFKLNPKP